MHYTFAGKYKQWYTATEAIVFESMKMKNNREKKKGIFLLQLKEITIIKDLMENIVNKEREQKKKFSAVLPSHTYTLTRINRVVFLWLAYRWLLELHSLLFFKHWNKIIDVKSIINL